MLPGPQKAVNGKPSCKVKMPPSCHPPTIASAARPFEPSHIFPFPKGSSYNQEFVHRLLKWKLDSPRSRLRSYSSGGDSDSPFALRIELPLSIDLPQVKELSSVKPL